MPATPKPPMPENCAELRDRGKLTQVQFEQLEAKFRGDSS
jgi:hypothetical protein